VKELLQETRAMSTKNRAMGTAAPWYLIWNFPCRNIAIYRTVIWRITRRAYLDTGIRRSNENLPRSHLAPFQRYCRFSAEKSDPTAIPPNFGYVSLDYIAVVGASKSENPKLINR